jgi:D-alanyl-D-alanine endopeptidase (penicillin-binding protein 7)
LTDEGLPNVQSVASIAIDAQSGEVVYEKNPDRKRHIASTGKIFVAMVARKKGIDLNALTEITSVDAKYARGGSRTRLVVGHKFRNQDLLRAMLISSDNRACTALGRAVGLSPKQLVAEMNAVAKDLGLKHTRFVDPSGLNGNTSTAREMATALGKALSDPFLAEIMGTEHTTVRSVAKKPHVIPYRNTNYSLHTQTYHVLGGKTGFTTPAGYCLLISAELDGRVVNMAFLGADAKMTRFGDFGRVAGWLKKRGTSAVVSK